MGWRLRVRSLRRGISRVPGMPALFCVLPRMVVFIMSILELVSMCGFNGVYYLWRGDILRAAAFLRRIYESAVSGNLPKRSVI